MNNRVLSILIILVLLLAALPASPAYAAEVMIDDFNTVHQNIINTGSSPPATRASSSAAMGTVTGGWQSLAITRTIGAAPNQVANASGSSAAPALVYGHSQDPSQEAYSAVHWDGNSDPDTINPIGLGGVDLVNGTNTHVILGHYFNDWPINYV
ncbi:MAG: hypothetical protein KJ734_05945, partial [Chloroflexi bacterium]|nr:hypothetical protein [Chloroflexota bacterium]